MLVTTRGNLDALRYRGRRQFAPREEHARLNRGINLGHTLLILLVVNEDLLIPVDEVLVDFDRLAIEFHEKLLLLLIL